MGNLTVALNAMLIEVYHNIIHLEEITLRKLARINLTINEIHLLEAVAGKKKTGITISELAEELNIKRPSATVAVNKLEKKGYVYREACPEDGRVVRVFLTRAGKRAEIYHRRYHRKMVHDLCRGLSNDEKQALYHLVKRMNIYFRKSIGE
ncbi:MAG: MarR family winged helix-turn-helix transcriptional regulator [Anaerovoracaceae bacterium]|jgi:DNA-binding MarR family transcriptional regulator